MVKVELVRTKCWLQFNLIVISFILENKRGACTSELSCRQVLKVISLNF